MLKIMTAAKRVVDTSVKVFALLDGSGPDVAKARMAINPFDEIAAEQAVRWRKAGIAREALTVSIGPRACEEVLRYCLALGVDRAALLETDAPLTAPATARVLAEIALREAPDVLLMGKQSTDGDHNQTAQITAALLGWPMAAFCSEIVPEGGVLLVSRETDGGAARAALSLPAVCTVDLRLNTPHRPSLPDVMRSRGRAVERVPELYPADAPSLEVLRCEEAPRRKRGRRVKDARELLDKLTEAGVL